MTLPAADPAAPLPPSRQERVAALRAHLAQVAPPRPARTGLPSGLETLDAAAGGWASPGLSEVVGRPGTGRLSLVLPAMRAVAARGRPVAVVDALGWLYPPGLPDLPLELLLVVRAGGRALWAAEQLARSAALPLVIVLDPPGLGRGARRLQQAAEAGGCAVILLTEAPDPHLRPDLRLQACGRGRFQLVRGGPAGGALVHA
ncbi:hypothetical protein L6R53_12145 [Myxococcota bacterium]|nr:hypothetical protein [Myxococcota bacterium]